MKYSNGKWNRPLIISMSFYCIMILDILINTVIAHITNNGVPRISNAIIIGPIVFNPISVLTAFGLGIIFFVIGLFLQHKKHNN